MNRIRRATSEAALGDDSTFDEASCLGGKFVQSVGKEILFKQAMLSIIRVAAITFSTLSTRWTLTMQRSLFNELGIRQEAQQRVDSKTPSMPVPWTGYGGIAATGDHANSSFLDKKAWTQTAGPRTAEGVGRPVAGGTQRGW